MLKARSESISNLNQVSGSNILVLCYGNIYRSPFVAAKLDRLLEKSEWDIRSAGFYKQDDRPCADDFIALSSGLGVDLANHRSCHVSKTDLNWADLIVIMDCNNRDLLCEMGDSVQNKIIWIAAWVEGCRADVRDPYGMPDDQVTVIASRLFRAADTLVDRLKKFSS